MEVTTDKHLECVYVDDWSTLWIKTHHVFCPCEIEYQCFEIYWCWFIETHMKLWPIVRFIYIYISIEWTNKQTGNKISKNRVCFVWLVAFLTVQSSAKNHSRHTNDMKLKHVAQDIVTRCVQMQLYKYFLLQCQRNGDEWWL